MIRSTHLFLMIILALLLAGLAVAHRDRMPARPRHESGFWLGVIVVAGLLSLGDDGLQLRLEAPIAHQLRQRIQPRRTLPTEDQPERLTFGEAGRKGPDAPAPRGAAGRARRVATVRPDRLRAVRI